MLRLAAIPERYSRCTLKSFDIGRSASAADAFLTAAKWIEAYPEHEKPGLLLVGAHNTGKTHIAVAVLREFVARGRSSLFADYPSLLEKIKDGYDGKGDKRPYSQALHCPMLLLDDLGAHRPTDWVCDTVAGILTHRLNNNLGLLATTNLAMAASNRQNGRIQIYETLEEKIGPQAFSKLQQLCQIVRVG